MVPPLAKQTIYSLGVILNMVTLGMVLAYPGTLIPSLKDPSSDIRIDDHTASWIASIPGISGLIPVLTLGPIMHIYGRKIANIIITVPIIVGWVLTYFTYEPYAIPILIISRALQGLSGGIAFFVSVCIGEFSTPRVRSVLLNMKVIAGASGIAIIHVLSTCLNWRQLALAGAISPSLALLITVFWPETPEWLASRGRFQEAEAVFFSIRGENSETTSEIKQVIQSEKQRQQRLLLRNKDGIIKKVTSPVLWKPVAILFCAIVVPAMGGRQYIPPYSVELAIQLSGEKSNGIIYTIIADLLGIVSVCFSIYFIKIFQRRQLLFGFGYASCVLLIICSALLYVRTNWKYEIISWLVLGSFALYYVVVNIGPFSVSYILMGEIFPLEYRAIGTVIDGILSCVCTAVIVGVKPTLEKSIGTHGMFLVFASIMVLSLTYLYFELPETKDRTLHDIGDYFRGKSPKIRRVREILAETEVNNILFTDK